MIRIYILMTLTQLYTRTHTHMLNKPHQNIDHTKLIQSTHTCTYVVTIEI